MTMLQQVWHERAVTNEHIIKGSEWTVMTCGEVYALQARVSFARAALINPDLIKSNPNLNIAPQEGDSRYLTYISAAEMRIIRQDVKTISNLLREKAGLTTMRSKLTGGLMHTFNETRYKRAHNALQISYFKFLDAAAESEQNKDAVFLHRNAWGYSF